MTEVSVSIRPAIDDELVVTTRVKVPPDADPQTLVELAARFGHATGGVLLIPGARVVGVEAMFPTFEELMRT